MSGGDINALQRFANESLESKGKDLSEAIESLPEILQKKTNLEAHTNILHAVMKKIAQREVCFFFAWYHVTA